MFVLLRIFIITVSLVFVAALGLTLAPRDVEAPPEEPPVVVEERNSPPAEAPAPETTEKPAEAVASEEKKATEAVGERVEQVAKALTAPAPVPISPISLNEKVREALVNVLCVPRASGAVNSITGSGVFIDPRGVILTNAHVAQYFLLEDYSTPGFLSCIIRVGSPAYPAYTAELLYLPPSWIQANAEKIDDQTPMGNGEHDYALLYVTGVIDQNKELPEVFPNVPLKYTEVEESGEVLVAGYPAGFLGGITIAKELYAASSPAKIGEIYTYATTTADIFSVGGSIVAQQGSSGGAVVDATGNLVGLIVTSTAAEETSARDLRALASSYIARDFESERGLSLPALFSHDLKGEVERFAAETAPGLTALLTAVLAK